MTDIFAGRLTKRVFPQNELNKFLDSVKEEQSSDRYYKYSRSADSIIAREVVIVALFILNLKEINN